MVRFKSCYHTSNFININGIAHHFVNDTWKQVPVDVEVTEHHLTSMFITTVDNAFNYTSHRNPGTHQQSPDHIAVMADIIAEMHEVHSGNGNGGVPHVSNVLAETNSNRFLSWLTGGGWGSSFFYVYGAEYNWFWLLLCVFL